MQKMSDHLRDYCQYCGSFFVNGDENKRMNLKPDKMRKLMEECLIDPGIFQKIGVVKKCSFCPK